MKIKILIPLLFASIAAAQSARFPAAIATDADLKVAKNQILTKLLAASLATDTVIVVTSSTGFVPNSLATIENEIVNICAVAGNNISVGVASCPNIDGRGFDGTTAAAHAANKSMGLYVDAWHRNSDKEEIKAIETFLGVNGSNLLLSIPATGPGATLMRSKPSVLPRAIEFAAPPRLVAGDYNFPAQLPGGSLIAAGNVVTLAPCPLGVNGTNAAHYLYVSGGVGTPESVLITGGTCTSGAASGTLIFTAGFAHSGAWQIQSATAGIQEAIRSTSATGVGAGPSVYVADGVYTLFATVTCDNYCSITGGGNNSLVFLKGFANGDLFYIGDTTTTVSGIGQEFSNFQIRTLPSVTDTSGWMIHVRYRYNVLLEHIVMYGDQSGNGQVHNGINIDNSLTISLYDCKIFNVTNTGLNLTSTPPNQVTARIVGVDVTGSSVTSSLVTMSGNVLSLLVDGLQMQGGGINWEINTNGGAFTESTISNIVFDSASLKAFSLHGTGNTFKIMMSNLEVATTFAPGTIGLLFDGSIAGVFQDIVVNNVTGGVNASNQIGTGLFIDTANNFLLTNSQIEGAGGGVGDAAVFIRGTTKNLTISNSVLGYSDSGGTVGAVAYRGVYIPSGTHTNMSFENVKIFGTSIDIGVGGTTTRFAMENCVLDPASATTISYTATGAPYFHQVTGLTDVLGSVPDAAAIALPANPNFIVTGAGTAVTSFTFPFTPTSASGTLLTTGGAITFTAGATIGNTFTSVLNVPVLWFYDGTKIYLR